MSTQDLAERIVDLLDVREHLRQAAIRVVRDRLEERDAVWVELVSALHDRARLSHDRRHHSRSRVVRQALRSAEESVEARITVARARLESGDRG